MYLDVYSLRVTGIETSFAMSRHIYTFKKRTSTPVTPVSSCSISNIIPQNMFEPLALDGVNLTRTYIPFQDLGV